MRSKSVPSRRDHLADPEHVLEPRLTWYQSHQLPALLVRRRARSRSRAAGPSRRARPAARPACRAVLDDPRVLARCSEVPAVVVHARRNSKAASQLERDERRLVRPVLAVCGPCARRSAGRGAPCRTRPGARRAAGSGCARSTLTESSCSSAEALDDAVELPGAHGIRHRAAESLRGERDASRGGGGEGVGQDIRPYRRPTDTRIPCRARMRRHLDWMTASQGHSGQVHPNVRERSRRAPPARIARSRPDSSRPACGSRRPGRGASSLVAGVLALVHLPHHAAAPDRHPAARRAAAWRRCWCRSRSGCSAIAGRSGSPSR